MVKEYPKLTVRVPPGLRRDLGLLAAAQGRTVADVIERALAAYFSSLPAPAKKALDELRNVDFAQSGLE